MGCKSIILYCVELLLDSMVVGYDCQNCGYQRDCDTDSKSGERLCPDCGAAVTGITGDLRGDGSLRVTYSDTEFNRYHMDITVSDPEDAYTIVHEESDVEIKKVEDITWL